MSRLTGEAVGEAVASEIVRHDRTSSPLAFVLSEATRGDRRALVTELWSDLARGGSLWSNVRLVHEGRDMHPSEFMLGRIGDGLVVHTSIDVASVTRHLNAGATFIYNHLHESSYGVQRIQEILEYRIGARVWIQAYLTQASETAFGLHADDHNFVALQLVGSKNWALDEAGAHALRVDDALFVQAGTPHSVSGVGELSLHLTIAFDWLPTEPNRPGSRLSEEAFAAHANVNRLGSGFPTALTGSQQDPGSGLRLASRVKPRLDDTGTHVLLTCSAGKYRFDRRLIPGLQVLQTGRQVSREELIHTCALSAAQVTAFVNFAVTRGVLLCGT